MRCPTIIIMGFQGASLEWCFVRLRSSIPLYCWGLWKNTLGNEPTLLRYILLHKYYLKFHRAMSCCVPTTYVYPEGRIPFLVISASIAVHENVSTNGELDGFIMRSFKRVVDSLQVLMVWCGFLFLPFLWWVPPWFWWIWPPCPFKREYFLGGFFFVFLPWECPAD